MYLKALEIQGFKSFPEKVTLTFEKDLTAIVGPNGSGKSNISDAISWVMGEQRSKALRGSKMEDVIFGGSEERSQLSFAQVSLILDNSEGLFDVDAPELMITRRYYRSGESEYYINKKSVRLKDVYSILMDTGLGRDGYSVIGQGRIDEIISAKSEDRRELFQGGGRAQAREDGRGSPARRGQDIRAGALRRAPARAGRDSEEVPHPPRRAARSGDIRLGREPRKAFGQDRRTRARIRRGLPPARQRQGRA